VLAEFFQVWWAANAVGEKADFTFETLAACERIFTFPAALLNRVRDLGWEAKRTPLAGVRMAGTDNVSGGVVENCDGALEVATRHFDVGALLFGVESGSPKVLATISNLPAVVYQSSKAYCVPYACFNVFGTVHAVKRNPLACPAVSRAPPALARRWSRTPVAPDHPAHTEPVSRTMG
jgi:hypothetical protein